MLGHFKKSASILTDQETEIVGNDRWAATICNTAYEIVCLFVFFGGGEFTVCRVLNRLLNKTYFVDTYF